CPKQTQCTKPPSGRRGRGLTFLPRDRYEALEAVRQAQGTDEWKDRYAIRAGVEGTISQAVRVTGLRRIRYRNLPTTRLGHVFAATAINLIRIDRWLTGTPLGGTEGHCLVSGTAGQVGRFCCSVYCLTMLRGAPLTVPAK
ncbi:transposase, partial [Streptomyces sp. NPDC050564]|uniref:transposase n=1 Tax=Streptomyces sp. NPDC050564 TaxID=3365631 RepID=UPI003789AEE9